MPSRNDRKRKDWIPAFVGMTSKIRAMQQRRLDHGTTSVDAHHHYRNGKEIVGMIINQQFLKMVFRIKILLIASIILLITTSFADDNIENSTENGALIVTLKVNYIDSENFSIVVKNNANHMLVPLDDLKAFNIKDEYLAS